MTSTSGETMKARSQARKKMRQIVLNELDQDDGEVDQEQSEDE